MTVGETTIKLYGSHTRRFVRWLAERGRAESDPSAWVDALQAITSGLTKKTWRLYRNAVTWHLRKTFGDAFAGRFLLATDAVEKPPTKHRKLLRHIEPDVLQIIVRELLRRRGERPKRLADMMIAMVTTGLRQKEFGTAVLSIGDKRMLVVRNAKYRPSRGDEPGRGNGPYRELILHDEASAELLGSLQRTLDWCRGREWSSQAPNANRLFRRVVKHLVSKREIGQEWSRLRIYDCRHQFSANAKANLGLLSGEIAAAMGHRSVVTAVSHYGKRRFARSATSFVSPSQRSIEAVSMLSAEKARRMIAKTEAGLIAKASRKAQQPAIGGTSEISPAEQRPARGSKPDTTG